MKWTVSDDYVTRIMMEKVNWLKQIGSGMVELLFPTKEVCPVCGQEEADQEGLGPKCLRRIAVIHPPICRKCGRPMRLEAAKEEVCQQCRETSYYFVTARAVALYEGVLREILAELKYRYRPELGEALGKLLVEWIKDHPEYKKNDLIIPIPINREKMAKRGYNQAELLANPLQRYLGIALRNDIMIRDKITESQNALQKEERFSNISGAFRVVDASPLTGARVLLVDDILTTGATVSEASRILLRTGAVEVKVLTLAAGVVESQWITT